MQIDLWASFVSGCVLGSSAGLAPGPLSTLMITETLANGPGAGIRVACAPLLTDLPIIVLTLFVLSSLSGSAGILGAISLAGAVFILLLALESWKAKPPGLPTSGESSRALTKGVIANFLNPHPYMFWIMVGGPILTKGWGTSALGPVAFLGGFYVCLVGAKVVTTLAVARSRQWLQGGVYTWLMRGLALALVFFAAMFLRDGYRLLTQGFV